MHFDRHRIEAIHVLQWSPPPAAIGCPGRFLGELKESRTGGERQPSRFGPSSSYFSCGNDDYIYQWEYGNLLFRSFYRKVIIQRSSNCYTLFTDPDDDTNLPPFVSNFLTTHHKRKDTSDQRCTMKVLTIFLLVIQLATAANYESGGASVETSQKTTQQDGGTTLVEKCVEYTAGAPEKYQTACFAGLINAGKNDTNITTQCYVTLDDGEAEETCDRCMICVTNAVDEDGNNVGEQPGFILDCDSHDPKKSTEGLCVPLTDAEITKVLTEGEFEGEEFAFDEVEPSTDDHSEEKEGSSAYLAIISPYALVATLAFFSV